ncbi:PREDICTED: uncharacterized protein LOC105964755 [Erythranthe guttata]|uniref:uncharacterized protein LOC105964755 n=1 Tax=Erythranthe guttata TaxID=4155 RepID=UPI00064DA722|nr:PREDICTED: uncharacterized protein LOC105964755 [Erythranthe guttata]|eukprot:XP_012844715.1 PREDICTED: uncharacterized protein LOC105964755 [Erythranthe guttata]
MDTVTDEGEVIIVLDQILDIKLRLLLFLRIYMSVGRRRLTNTPNNGRTYSLIAKIPKQQEILHDLVGIDDVTCRDNLRMNMDTFKRLCYLLEHRGGLLATKNVQIPEQVAMFLSILAHHTKNVVIRSSFKRSGFTVSKHFNRLLAALLKLHSILLVTPQPVSDDSDNQRWKFLKGCLGALDGTYINVRVSRADKPRYRNRKGDIAVNVLAVCDVNMNFVYLLTGWEGSAADSRVLRDAITRSNGLKIPTGHYYLVDNGYTNGDGFLSPYRGKRYHLQYYGQGTDAPQNYMEYFNMTHAKARNVIERAFGILKSRFAILRSSAYYPIKAQNRIVMACSLLHNFIRTTNDFDPEEAVVPEDPEESDDDEENDNNDVNDAEYINVVEPSQHWTNWRDNLAQEIFMDRTGSSSKVVTSKGRSTNTRRTWTLQEEQGLLQALKDIVARGWKCDNGFKTGYLATLEGAMSVAFPGTDLKAEPHIHSKIHVWKKYYGSLSTMLSRSGFGCNDSSCTIDMHDDQVWADYIKSDTHARTMRFKAWPYYKDWVIIFGKDCATGEYAEAFNEAVNNLVHPTKGNEHTVFGGDDYSFVDAPNDEFSNDLMSIAGADSASSSKSKPKSKNKRGRTNDIDARLVDMMSTFFDKADDKLGRIVNKIGFEFDVSESRKKVFDALNPFEFLSGENKLHVTKVICESTKNMDIFFSVNEDHKAIMVNMILNGRF